MISAVLKALCSPAAHSRPGAQQGWGLLAPAIPLMEKESRGGQGMG